MNTSLMEVGKLCLAAVFQIPCASRAKPSSMYLPQYYERIFNGDQRQIANLYQELLYIDYYFRTQFQKKFDRDNGAMPDVNERIAFAHNARTICIAFVAFSSRYVQGNITRQDLQAIFDSARRDSASDSTLYDIFSDIKNVQHFIPPAIFANRDKYDEILDRLFQTIINAGITNFTTAKLYDPALNATNFLKRDKNYYSILMTQWGNIDREIMEIYGGMEQ